MGRKPKLREIHLLRDSLPLVVAEAAYSIIYLTDTSMVATLGDTQLAALGTNLTLLLLISSFGIGYLATVNTLVAHSLARKRYRHCGMYAWQGIWTAWIIGMIAVAVLYPLTPKIFGLFGHEPDVFFHEVPYFQISLWSLSPEMGALALSAYFVAVGKPKKALQGAAIAAIANFLFNYLLIWGHFGFPRLGMVGSAWATVFASLIHFLFLFGLFISKGESRYATRKPRPLPEYLARLGDLGIPAGLQAAVEFFSWGVILLALVGSFGTADLAAGTILFSLAQAAYLPADGIGTYLLAQVASAVGKKKYRLARIRAYHGMRLILSYLAIVAVVLAVFRTPIMSGFTDSREIISIGEKALPVVCFILVADAAGIVLLHCLQGAGDILWPTAVSIFSAMVILVGGGATIVIFFPEFGSLGVWIVAAIYVTCQSLAYLARWRSGRWTHLLFG